MNEKPVVKIKTLHEVELEQIKLALKLFSGNRTLTAKALGTTAKTIRAKIKDFGLED